MTKTRRFIGLAAAALAACLAPALAYAQHATPLTIADSYSRARALLESAIGAHGGPAALVAARQIRLTMRGNDVWRNQSRRVNPPYDSEPLNTDLHIDLRRGRLVSASWSMFPGGIPRAGAFVSDSARHYRVDYRAQTFTNAQYPPAEQQTGNLFYVPQLILAAARQNIATARWIGRMQLSTGAPIDVIAASIAGQLVNLAFDPDTKHLRATLAVFPDALLGDAGSEVEFTGYRQLNGMVLPTRRITRTGGEVTRELTYTAATLNYSLPDSLAAPPAGYVAAAPAPPVEPIRAIAPGVWAVGGGSAALVVALRDYLLIVDAPFVDDGTVERIKALAPGKPIRYVIPTHHHSDHASGVKQYVAAGATIVTTPANQAYMEKLATARSTISPEAPALAGKPVIEIISNKRRVFSDGARTVEIHDIGPNPHADEMLVAWIPEEGILFQGDLIDVGSNGVVTRGMNNQTTRHFAEWLRKQNWNVRIYGGTHGFLKSPADFQALVGQADHPFLF